MLWRSALLGLLWMIAAGCTGPEAPDAAVCADVIEHVCGQPLCPSVAARLPPGADCAAVMFGATGCFDESFAFTSPTRERVLACRQPLLRVGQASDAASRCEDVDTLFDECPDVGAFLFGDSP